MVEIPEDPRLKEVTPSERAKREKVRMNITRPLVASALETLDEKEKDVLARIKSQADIDRFGEVLETSIKTELSIDRTSIQHRPQPRNYAALKREGVGYLASRIASHTDEDSLRAYQNSPDIDKHAFLLNSILIARGSALERHPSALKS